VKGRYEKMQLNTILDTWTGQLEKPLPIEDFSSYIAH
jgi:hypothetical protein